VADKRCDNGHFIDESWDLCPYCPADNAEPDIPVVRPSRLATAAEPPKSLSVAPSIAARPVAVPPPPPQAVTGAGNGPVERTIAVQRPSIQPVAADAATKRYVVGWLIGLNGAVRGESYALRMGRNVLGRDRRSDVVVNDDQASSHHADLVFRPEERRFILMDHNSTNGTYVNEVEIEQRRDLTSNDVVRIGSHRFLFLPLCHDGFYWDDEGPLK
jgi:hypothetical protein